MVLSAIYMPSIVLNYIVCSRLGLFTNNFEHWITQSGSCPIFFAIKKDRQGNFMEFCERIWNAYLTNTELEGGSNIMLHNKKRVVNATLFKGIYGLYLVQLR